MKHSIYTISIFLLFTLGMSHAQEIQQFPNIITASASVDGNQNYRFNVTVSSPYDSAKRYADAYRIKDASGTVYGIRVLTHDHANEQPFTRSISGISIPSQVTEVIIEGRDKTYGWGGATFTLKLP